MELDRSGVDATGKVIDDVSLFTLIKHRLFRKKSRTNKKSRIVVTASITVIVLGAAAIIGWRLFIWQPANIDPFTPQITSSLQFPLFHPTYVPAGYRVDPKSVAEPTTGVVVFSLDGPSKEKIYISEEARPTKYDIGGFFAKFSGLKETAISGGTIATGKIANSQTEIGSMLTNQVWIISNTNASVPMDQITQLVKGLSSSVAP